MAPKENMCPVQTLGNMFQTDLRNVVETPMPYSRLPVNSAINFIRIRVFTRRPLPPLPGTWSARRRRCSSPPPSSSAETTADGGGGGNEAAGGTNRGRGEQRTMTSSPHPSKPPPPCPSPRQTPATTRASGRSNRRNETNWVSGLCGQLGGGNGFTPCRHHAYYTG